VLRARGRVRPQSLGHGGGRPVDRDDEHGVRSRLVAIALEGLRARVRAGSEKKLPGEPPSQMT
jgi:hypothetical protein